MDSRRQEDERNSDLIHGIPPYHYMTHIPEDYDLNLHHCENLKYHNFDCYVSKIFKMFASLGI
jgi:hypothetical protein